MKNDIFCGIASSLGISLNKIQNLTFQIIKSNDDIKKIGQFAILILDKETHALYSEKRFVSEIIFDAIAYYDKDTNRPQDVIDVCEVFSHLLSFPGILSHQQIATLLKLGILIYNGKLNRVKGASYDLLIDKEYLKSGIEVLSADTFKIDPLDYVVVGACESVNIPKNICATFDTKVSMFCKGIILSNGPQVDPGYQGRLLCLLFNTSAKEFEISPATDFEFSTIQFCALSEPTDKPYAGRYLRKENLRDYIGSFADESIAALVKSIPEIRNSIKGMEEAVGKLRKTRFTTVELVIGIIITLLLSAVGAAFYFGSINNKIETIDNRLKKVEDRNNTEKEITIQKSQPSLESKNKKYQDQKSNK